MSYSIAFIAPYKKLGELFSEVCREINKDIPVVIGDLEEGTRKAVESEEQGVKEQLQKCLKLSWKKREEK